jgi:hypothetical protein
VLNYEEVDVNQCPGDRSLNAFSSTALCDSTTECLPLPYYGLTQGGYECHCVSSYHYPFNFQGPYKGKELNNADGHTYPLCMKSEGLLQYPNWISKNAIDYIAPNTGTSYGDYNFNLNLKRRDLSAADRHKRDVLLNTIDSFMSSSEYLDKKSQKKSIIKAHRFKRFIDKRNNFEKLRDAVFSDQNLLRRTCLSMPFQDIVKLNEDDERFILNLRFYIIFQVNLIFA